MELWAQGSEPVSGSRGRPFIEPTARLRKRTVSRLDPTTFYYHAYDPVRSKDAATVDSEISLSDIFQSEKGDSPLSYYDSGSTTMQASPIMLPATWESISNKRLRLDNTEVSPEDAEAATCSRAIAGGPFSTPHFRLSLGASKRPHDQFSEALGFSRSEPGPQGSDDGFGDDIGIEKLVFLEKDSSPLDRVSSHSPAAQLPHKAYDGRRASSPLPPHEAPPPNPPDVLLDCTLSYGDRIQRMGNEMRKSAAAKIARFNVPIQPFSHTVLDLKHANGLKEDQEQDQEHVSDNSSTPTVPSTEFLNIQSGHHELGRTHPWNRRQYQSCPFPISMDEVSSPLSNTAMAVPIVKSNRHCALTGAGSSRARPDTPLDTTRLPCSAMVSHPNLPQDMLRSWSANTTNTELLQTVGKGAHDPADV